VPVTAASSIQYTQNGLYKYDVSASVTTASASNELDTAQPDALGLQLRETNTSSREVISMCTQDTFLKQVSLCPSENYSDQL
jgi:hypothetical protein